MVQYWTRVHVPLRAQLCLGFPGGLEGKASACSVGVLGSIPGLGRSHGKGNHKPLSTLGLENSMDGGA